MHILQSLYLEATNQFVFLKKMLVRVVYEGKLKFPSDLIHSKNMISKAAIQNFVTWQTFQRIKNTDKQNNYTVCIL